MQGESSKNAFVHFYCRTAAYCALRNSKRLKISHDWRGMPLEFVRTKGLDKQFKLSMMYDGSGRYGIEDADRMAEDGSAQTFEWYLKNHLGSTMLVYGTGAGTPGGLLAAYDYRSFGEQVTLTESADKVTENFTGKEKDDETQLDYFGERYLDPMLGMWTSVDKARQFDSPYLYMGNGTNPIKLNDPDGNAVPLIVAVGFVIVRNIAIRAATQAVTRATVAAVPVAMKAVDLAQKSQLPQNLKYAVAAGAAGEALSHVDKRVEKAFDEVVDNMGNVMSDPATALFGFTKNITQDAIQNPPNIKAIMNEAGNAINQGMDALNQGMSQIGDAANQSMNNFINQNINNGISDNVKNALNQ